MNKLLGALRALLDATLTQHFSRTCFGVAFGSSAVLALGLLTPAPILTYYISVLQMQNGYWLGMGLCLAHLPTLRAASTGPSHTNKVIVSILRGIRRCKLGELERQQQYRHVINLVFDNLARGFPADQALHAAAHTDSHNDSDKDSGSAEQ
jgi:hypothetical protein